MRRCHFLPTDNTMHRIVYRNWDHPPSSTSFKKLEMETWDWNVEIAYCRGWLLDQARRERGWKGRWLHHVTTILRKGTAIFLINTRYNTR